MTERMPDFTMPSDAEVAAERRAAEVEPSAASQARPRDRDAHRADTHAPGADAGGDAIVADAPSSARPAVRRPDALRGRLLAVVRRPIVAFAAGAALVAVAALSLPALTTFAERGSIAQLRQAVDAYVDAIEAGDAEALLALEPVDDERDSVALLEAGIEPTSPVEVDCSDPEPRANRETTFVDCTVIAPGSMMAPTGEAARIRLDRVDGAWRIATGLLGTAPIADGGIPYAPILEVVAISGIPLTGIDLPDDAALLLLPGMYDIELDVPDGFEVEDYGGLVMTPAGGSVQAAAVADESLRAQAQSVAVEFVDACLVDEASALACGLSYAVEDGELDASTDGFGYATATSTYVMQVSVHGAGTPLPLAVDVALVLADDGSITMRVDSVHGTG